MAASGLQLPATLVFDYPTLEALATYLLEEMAVVGSDATSDLGAELDKLQLTLSAMSGEEAKRSGMAARLQSILAAWASEEQQATEDDQTDDDLNSVSDDEIFELIDREFGVS
jgi:acyl carrier protein